MRVPENPVLEAIGTARAIRRFSDEPVTDEELWAVLEAAQAAPSGGNVQPWQFLVLTELEPIAAVAAVYEAAYDRYERTLLASLPPFRTEADEESFHKGVRASRYLAEHLTDAKAIVCVLQPAGYDLTLHDDAGPLDIGHGCASVYPAVQNLIVAARSLGIGATLTTVARVLHDELRAAAGIPDRYELAALVPLGRPRGSFGRPRRRPAAAVTHWNRWGEKREGPSGARSAGGASASEPGGAGRERSERGRSPQVEGPSTGS